MRTVNILFFDINAHARAKSFKQINLHLTQNECPKDSNNNWNHPHSKRVCLLQARRNIGPFGLIYRARGLILKKVKIKNEIYY